MAHALVLRVVDRDGPALLDPVKIDQSCWRKLNPGKQALLVLVYLRKDETFAEAYGTLDHPPGHTSDHR